MSMMRRCLDLFLVCLIAVPASPQVRPQIKAPVPKPKIAAPAEARRMAIVRRGTIDQGQERKFLACAQLPNGRIGIARQTLSSDRKFVGELAIFGPDMSPTGASVYFTQPQTNPPIGELSLAGFAGNAFLLAYSDLTAQKGRYLVIDDRARTAKGPVDFSDTGVTNIALAPLAGRATIFLAYQKVLGNTGRGEFVVLNGAGDRVQGPTVFASAGWTRAISAAAMSDGSVFLAFMAGYPTNRVVDVFGNAIRESVRFLLKPMRQNRGFALADGRILFVCAGDDYRGLVTVLDRNGLPSAQPLPFTADAVAVMAAERLADGRVLVAYLKNVGQQLKGYGLVLSADGRVAKDPVPIDDPYFFGADHLALAALSDGSGLIVYGGYQRIDPSIPGTVTKYLVVR